MKLIFGTLWDLLLLSPPSRGAWIEIKPAGTVPINACSRPPRGGRGLKYKPFAVCGKQIRSPPSRGAWIEIVFVCFFSNC